MRKRDAARLSKILHQYRDELTNLVIGQLDSAAWYFDNNSEIKGFNFAFAAAENAKVLCERIKETLSKEDARLSNIESADKKYRKGKARSK